MNGLPDLVASFLVGLIAIPVCKYVFNYWLGPRFVWARELQERREKKIRAKRMERRRSRTARSTQRAQGTFTVAPGYTVDFTLVDGGGDAPIPRGNVSSQLTHTTVELPDVFQPWREEALATIEEKQTAGSEIWNGPRYAVKAHIIGRREIDEAPSSLFLLHDSDYANFLATQRLDEELTDGQTPRQLFLMDDQDPTNPIPPDRVPAFMCNSIGAHALVQTADGFVAFRRRSGSVSAQPRQLGATMSEGVSATVDSQGQGPPDLWRLAERGLEEEVGLFPEDYDLHLLGIGLSRDVNQWVLLYFAELYELTADELSARIDRGVKDRWEHAELDFVRFRPKDALTYLGEDERRRDQISCLAPLTYHALVYRFGRRMVEREIRSLRLDEG